MKINQKISLIAIAHLKVNYPDIFMDVHLFLSCKGEGKGKVMKKRFAFFGLGALLSHL